MDKPITDVSLSIVREVVSKESPFVTLPRRVVQEMVARIDIQHKQITRYRVLVDCHDNYLIEVVNATRHSGVTDRLRRLDKARELVAEMEIEAV
jgi:hypothetical protein